MDGKRLGWETPESLSLSKSTVLEWINGYLGDSNDSLSKSTLKIHLRICEVSCATSTNKTFPPMMWKKESFCPQSFFLFSIFLLVVAKKKGALLKEEELANV